MRHGGLPVTAVFDDDQIMQYLLAPQNGKYEAPENAAALLQQTLSDEHALDEQEMTKLYREIELPLLSHASYGHGARRLPGRLRRAESAWRAV